MRLNLVFFLLGIISRHSSGRVAPRFFYHALFAEAIRAFDRTFLVSGFEDNAIAEIEYEDALDSLLRRRALHVVGENERVRQALELLRSADARGFGALMYASHESSRNNFENSTPELDLLVDLARELPGVLGARLTGAGFGGATVTLCDRTFARQVAAELARMYMQRTGIKPGAFVCRIANGAE